MLSSPVFVPTGPGSTFVPTGPSIISSPSSTFVPTGPSILGPDPFFVPTGPSLLSSPTSSSVFITSDPYLPSDVLLSPTLSPYPLTISFDFDKPLIGVYETIDTSPEVRKRLTKYYYDLVRDQWLMDELNDILNYYVYSDGNVRLIKSLSDYDPRNIAKDTDKIAEKKIEFIEETILTKYDLIDILVNFTKNMHIKWVDLPKHEYLLRQAIKEYLVKEIKRKLKKE